jgi:protein phosphatase
MVRDFCLYGETAGGTDEFGLPALPPWADEYRGRAPVVYGHTQVLEAVPVNGTICIDTGCVFGGKLTAFRYPERVTVQVDAFSEHCPPARQLKPPRAAPAAAGDLFRIEDLAGIRTVSTRLLKNVRIDAEGSAAALEVMSRFAADPRRLIYLPPTMSPCETGRVPGFLERPEEAMSCYLSGGAAQRVCEEKHMGSRAVIVCPRDAGTAAGRFGVGDGSSGIVHTRTGGSSSTTPPTGTRRSPASGPPWTLPDSGSAFPRTGSAWTARSRPGRPRP